MEISKNLFFYPEQGELDANTYLIKGESCIIIDPGSKQCLPQLVREIEKDGITVTEIKTIIHTHLHIDHYWANEGLKKESGAKILIHSLQKQHWNETVVATARLFGLAPVVFKEDGFMDNCNLGPFEIIGAPGHSPDSICYYDKITKVLICGDVVFNGNIGRVDLPGGNASQLKQSVISLSQLDIEYLLPGHMNIITGARAVKQNFEFIKENAFAWL